MISPLLICLLFAHSYLWSWINQVTISLNLFVSWYRTMSVSWFFFLLLLLFSPLPLLLEINMIPTFSLSSCPLPSWPLCFPCRWSRLDMAVDQRPSSLWWFPSSNFHGYSSRLRLDAQRWLESCALLWYQTRKENRAEICVREVSIIDSRIAHRTYPSNHDAIIRIEVDRRVRPALFTIIPHDERVAQIPKRECVLSKACLWPFLESRTQSIDGLISHWFSFFLSSCRWYRRPICFFFSFPHRRQQDKTRQTKTQTASGQSIGLWMSSDDMKHRTSTTNPSIHLPSFFSLSPSPSTNLESYICVSIPVSALPITRILPIDLTYTLRNQSTNAGWSAR